MVPRNIPNSKENSNFFIFNVNLKAPYLLLLHYIIILNESTKTTEDFAVTQLGGSKTVGRKFQRPQLLVLMDYGKIVCLRLY